MQISHADHIQKSCADFPVGDGIPLWDCPGKERVLVGCCPGAIPLQFNTIHCTGSCVAPLQVCPRVYSYPAAEDLV